MRPPLNLAHETEAHQVMLEAHRLRPDDELVWQDYCKAKARMEVAWAEHIATLPPL